MEYHWRHIYESPVLVWCRHTMTPSVFHFLGNVGKRPWSFSYHWACVINVTRAETRWGRKKLLNMLKTFSSVQRLSNV